MGFLTKKTKVSDEMIENGIRGTATVQKGELAIGGVTEYEGYMSQKKIEQVLTGERSMSSYKLELLVEIPGRDPYQAKIKVPVPSSKVKFMTGGSVVPVLVDPAKESRVAIDWDGAFTQGTVAEMASANPMVAAALKGAGVDVNAIAAMQEAARAAGQTPGNIIVGGQLLGAPTPPADPIAQLKQLAELRDSGVLTEAEFEAQKAKLLA